MNRLDTVCLEVTSRAVIIQVDTGHSVRHFTYTSDCEYDPKSNSHYACNRPHRFKRPIVDSFAVVLHRGQATRVMVLSLMQEAVERGNEALDCSLQDANVPACTQPL